MGATACVQKSGDNFVSWFSYLPVCSRIRVQVDWLLERVPLPLRHPTDRFMPCFAFAEKAFHEHCLGYPRPNQGLVPSNMK